MMDQETVDKLQGMRLRTMAQVFRELVDKPEDSLTFAEKVGMMVDREWLERDKIGAWHSLITSQYFIASCALKRALNSSKHTHARYHLPLHQRPSFMRPMTASTLTNTSSHSFSGSDKCVIAPPAPKLSSEHNRCVRSMQDVKERRSLLFPLRVMVLMTTDRSVAPSYAM